MTLDEVGAVLGGVWSRSGDPAIVCTYSSDRGAVFGITPVDYAPYELEDAMISARLHNCDTEPIDVPDTGGGFVCTENIDGVDNVEGNLVVGDHFWLFLILADDPGADHSAEENALIALMDAVQQA